MRLTLRTLLAYLDDTLEPSQTKLIGQKIAESPAAQELIARIKEVVRKRRLTTPPASGAGAKLEPNTIAEYIDSVLPTDQLAEVEEICLETDVYLAEVAACHQILTIVLSEPALVPPTANQRMYGLIRGRGATSSRPAAAAPARAGSPERPGADGHHDADDTLLLGLPFYRRQGTLFRWLAPLAGVVLLIIGLVVMFKALPSPDQTPPTQSGTQLAQAGDTAKEKLVPVVAPKPEDPPEPRPKPETDPKPEPTPGPEATVKPEPTPPPEPKPEPKVKPPLVKRESREIGRYVMEDGTPASILLRRGEKDQWQRLQPRRAVSTNDFLVSLPGYRSEVRLDNDVNLVLWGAVPDGRTRSFVLDSAVQVNDSPDVDLDLTLDRGRIALTNQKPNGAAKVRVRFHDEVWDINLPGKNDRVAVELIGVYMPGVGFNKKGDGEGPWAALGLYVLRGQAGLQVRYDTYSLREPQGPALFVWDNLGQASRGPEMLKQLPPWADTISAPRPPQAMRLALEDLNVRLAGKAPVDVVLSEALKEREPAMRELAVYCLGATDDLPELLDALANEDHPDVRWVGTAVLRHWIGRRPDHDMKLYKVLEKKYNPTHAETIMVLLHSFSEAALAEPATYETLIAYLRHDKLPIRELAFQHLALRVPDIAKTIPYDPAGGSDQRERAYDEWKKRIPDGQVPPKPKPGIPGKN